MDHTTRLNLSKPGARGTHPSSQELRDAIINNADTLDPLEYALSSYKTMHRAHATLANPASGTYSLSSAGASGALAPAGATNGSVFYVEPLDRAADASRSVLFRLRASLLVGHAAAPGTVNIGLQRVTTWGTGTTPAPSGMASIAASFLTFASPAIDAHNVQISGDFPLASDWYFLCVSSGGSAATIIASAELQYHTI